MNDFGAFCLVVSLGLLIFSIYQTLVGIIKKDEASVKLGTYTLLANSGIILLAFIVLMTQLIRMDLTNHYVVMHSADHLPMFYRITSIWSGSSGSLLFWSLLLSIFSFIVLRETSKIDVRRLPWMNLSLGILACFFSFLAVFFEDAQPFREFKPGAVVGRGLNPLLQHWAMIIHPPILYIGYVSFAIPFCVGMSALLSGEVTPDWLKQIRKWSLFSWFFLGVGILLGSKWAYEELGWGGYWAWDPVENASLMPWLLASAFIHSIIIEERRGMLKFWNMFLIILTFHATLLGTWITRSGVLEGPHSFAKSTIGTPFILFIIISFIAYSGILIYKRNNFKPERELEAITSKEGSFLLNNFLLVIACLTILLGVFSPLLYGKEFKSPWYNAWGIPMGIFLLLLMGASPLLAWKKSADSIFFTTLSKPTLVGIVVSFFYGIVYSNFFTRSDYSTSDTLGEIYSTLTVGLGAFTISGIFQEYHRGVQARREATNETYFIALGRMLMKNRRRYGGYLVHLSIVLIFLGYAGNAFKENTSFRFFYELMPSKAGDEVIYVSNDKAMIGNYSIEAKNLKLKPILNTEEAGVSPTIYNVVVSEEAVYSVNRHKNEEKTMLTERRFYPQVSHLTGDFETHIPTSEPSIFSTAKEDFYVQLGAIENVGKSLENPDLPMLFMQYYFGTRNITEKVQVLEKFPKQIVANLEVWVNPLVKLIWVGSLMFFFSGLFVMYPTKT
ncbi:MAG: cytochrome c biogenesis protein CcsA [Leptospiraceae bacterium]|nr:cytochrome c biogenesis protein CcsA [Leptospiraceae bacterium]